MQDFKDKHILLGICGGIAAYKSAYLVRELIQLGAQVRVVMTKSAQAFITPLTFQALTGEAVRTELFDEEAERAMGHIELARWADYLIIAPATANTLAKLAHGLADDLLSTLYLVFEGPVFLCPAMNKSMWQHPVTQDNITCLEKRGAIVVGPSKGEQACGEYGFGRLTDTADIINALRFEPIRGLLKGVSCLITAGPTQEPLDPVRYLSNHSSGKMGYALAKAAVAAGASVTLISGPTALTPPSDVEFYSVITADEMQKTVTELLKPGMLFIGCAAVADYKPVSMALKKLKKNQNPLNNIELTENPDILLSVVESKKAAYVVGFAAETDDLLTHATVKLASKKVDMLIANEVGSEKGFGQDWNKVTVLTKNTKMALEPKQKLSLAADLIAIIATNLHNTAFVL